MAHEKPVWERGVDRIANLATISGEVLDDAWERFKLVFTMQDPKLGRVFVSSEKFRVELQRVGNKY